MDPASTFFAALLAKRKALAEAKRHVELMEAELRGFEEARRLLMGQSKPAPGAADQDVAGGSNDARRALSAQWRGILRSMADAYPKDVSLDDLERTAAELGTPTNRNTLRSQMSVYAERGLVDRTVQGRYRLTPAGAEQVGVTLPPGTIPPTIGPEASAPPSSGLGTIIADDDPRDHEPPDDDWIPAREAVAQ